MSSPTTPRKPSLNRLLQIAKAHERRQITSTFPTPDPACDAQLFTDRKTIDHEGQVEFYCWCLHGTVPPYSGKPPVIYIDVRIDGWTWVLRTSDAHEKPMTYRVPPKHSKLPEPKSVNQIIARYLLDQAYRDCGAWLKRFQDTRRTA